MVVPGSPTQSESDPNPRRRNMQANRRRDTTPELALRRLLHKEGLRYRCDLRIDLPGAMRARPDVVFTRRKVAVFVDGCFWHGCPVHGRTPTTNVDYWSVELARNLDRDRLQTRALQDAGWTVIRIWGHEDLDSGRDRVVSALQRGAKGR